MKLSRRRVVLAVGSISAILALVIGVRWLQRRILFPREMVRPVPAALRTPGLERWWIESDEGPVEAWLLPGDGVDEEHPGPAVLFAHGNGELIDHWPRMLDPYRRLGVSVVLFEYRGYGRSAGAPSEDALAEDARAALERATADPRVDADRLVYHGRSLGGGVVATLLDDHPPRALVLESTFTSVPEVADWAPSFLIVDRFESLPRFARYEGPLLVFHGTRDGVVPFEHGRRIARAHRDATLVPYPCGHNDLPPPGTDYWARIEAHLTSAGVIER